MVTSVCSTYRYVIMYVVWYIRTCQSIKSVWTRVLYASHYSNVHFIYTIFMIST
jgi:hypothetical protein